MSTAENGQTPELFTATQKILIRNLFRHNLIKVTDGPLSIERELPYVVDLASAQNDSTILAMIAEEYVKSIKKSYLEFDFISGVSNACIPTATLVSGKLGYGMLTPRINKVDHNGNTVVEGFTQDFVDKKVLLVDAAPIKGRSMVQAARVLRNKGMIVNSAVVLLDRQEGAREALQDNGIKLVSVFRAGEMFEYAKDAGTNYAGQVKKVLSHEDYESLRPYLKPKTG